MESELTLLMTATIDPKGMPSAATVPDPVSRETDYAAALSFYLEHHPRIRRFVFAENSGWPLDRLQELASKSGSNPEIEFCSFRLNDFPREWGKSYGEAQLMDHAFAESKLIKKSRYVAKVTGRIIVQNLTDIIERAPAPFDFYADLRDHPLYEWAKTGGSGRHGEARFFVITPSFYQTHFEGKFASLKESEGHYLETLIYNIVKQNLSRGKVYGRFRNEPQYRGIAGHFGKNYSSPKEKCKQFIRGTSRKLIPWLWI